MPGGGTVVAPAGGATAGGPVQPKAGCGRRTGAEVRLLVVRANLVRGGTLPGFFGAAPTRARQRNSTTRHLIVFSGVCAFEFFTLGALSTA